MSAANKKKAEDIEHSRSKLRESVELYAEVSSRLHIGTNEDSMAMFVQWRAARATTRLLVRAQHTSRPFAHTHLTLC